MNSNLKIQMGVYRSLSEPVNSRAGLKNQIQTTTNGRIEE
jgi:hypothetical protein